MLVDLGKKRTLVEDKMDEGKKKGNSKPVTAK